MNTCLLLWVVVGFPIYIINFVLFQVFLWAFGSTTIAFWSWIVASPLTLKIWDHLDVKNKVVNI